VGERKKGGDDRNVFRTESMAAGYKEVACGSEKEQEKEKTKRTNRKRKGKDGNSSLAGPTKTKGVGIVGD